jgi:hypothetical protein
MISLQFEVDAFNSDLQKKSVKRGKPDSETLPLSEENE